MEARRIFSARGRQLLLVDGFTYCKNTVLKKSGEIFWICTTKTCRSKIYTLMDEETVSRCVLLHNHDKNLEVLNRKIISNTAKRRGLEDVSQLPSKVLDKILEEIPAASEVLTKSDKLNIYQCVSRKRKLQQQLSHRNKDESLDGNKEMNAKPSGSQDVRPTSDRDTGEVQSPSAEIMPSATPMVKTKHRNVFSGINFTIAFIKEMEIRPCLWDTRLQKNSAKDRGLKESAWLEIAKILCGGFEDLDLAAKVSYLKSRWKYIKKLYAKLLKTNSKVETSCKYFEHLHFLQPVMKFITQKVPLDDSSNKQVSTTSDVSSCHQISTSQDISPYGEVSTTSCQQDSYLTSPIGQTLVEEIQANDENAIMKYGSELQDDLPRAAKRPAQQSPNLGNVNVNSESLDSDKHFLLSLLDDLNRIPEECQLQVKIDIMTVLEKGKQPVKNRKATKMPK